MKKESVVISHKARTSLRGYVEYLKKEVSPEIADYVRKGILKKCRNLKDFSGYSEEPYLEATSKEYRSLSIWSYNIIYKVNGNEVRILNIVHTSKDPQVRKDI